MNNKLRFKRLFCPITNALDLLGDKWTILIVKDLALGKESYQEFLTSPERIATNILADRLKRLQDADIAVRQAYQHSPVRYKYTLTDRGRDLNLLLQALYSWGIKNLPGTNKLPSVRSQK